MISGEHEPVSEESAGRTAPGFGGPSGTAPVTAAGQPALHALVAGVARTLRLPPTTRVWLTADAAVTRQADLYGRHLIIGLPLLSLLSGTELRALVGHELALLHRPDARRADRALAKWSSAVWDEAVQELPADPRREPDPYVAELQDAADQAAITAAGGAEPAARAVALATLSETGYLVFRVESGPPLLGQWWWQFSDLLDGWDRAVRYGLGDAEWDAETAAVLARLHPRLSGALTALGRESLPLVAAARSVPVVPLSVHKQRRLIRALTDQSVPTVLWWRTYETAPARRWRRRAAKDARSIRAHLAAALGRDLVDDVEAIRAIETGAAPCGCGHAGGHHEFTAGDPAVSLVEDHLLRRGWRLEHPAVRGVLIGPDGRRVDAIEILRAGADSAVVRELLGSE
ncbi:hypothetical protein GCM10010399_13570 [Dactylosporangium fulvum]|uniref:Peptidase M48 domain-containing protein n=1 Tax=Dactylosporangium fulvum TaxID=53359 RepID=A0ABY5W591_9ACTN|nr:hypothetical protein [Dactylosporangium fulvum]UWP85222.1 hypothetical protein Dfulv_13720 [Dactylosporangium fulvum]